MKLSNNNRTIHLTYCTNIHPAETWSETFEQLKNYLPQVFDASQWNGIGLRLSAKAAKELNQSEELATFKAWLNLNKYYINTLNGFPFGNFHGTKIKEAVYSPDWSNSARLEYSLDLANILAYLSPIEEASISTVPIGFKSDFRDHNKIEAAVKNLELFCDKAPKNIKLALEPEPFCLLEDTESTLDFFKKYITSKKLKEQVGLCYDTCHFAIRFDDQIENFKKIKQSIPIYKYQLSSGLAFTGTHSDFHQKVLPFIDGHYLHQYSTKNQDGLNHFLDLDQKFDVNQHRHFEHRVHFHTPLFINDFEDFTGTNEFTKLVIEQALQGQQEIIFECETYTFDVLPPHLKENSVATHIKKELQWVQQQLAKH